MVCCVASREERARLISQILTVGSVLTGGTSGELPRARSAAEVPVDPRGNSGGILVSFSSRTGGEAELVIIEAMGLTCGKVVPPPVPTSPGPTA